MKQIRTVSSATITVSTEGTDVTAAIALVQDARRNKAKVIDAAATIESCLQEIVSYYFFADRADPKKPVFDSLVLSSDWCTFSAKRKLFNHIVKSVGLLSSKELASLDELLAAVVRYRNAFAHGHFSVTDGLVSLSYFQGTPQQITLTDEALSKIEDCLLQSVNQLQEISLRFGVTKQSELPSS